MILKWEDLILARWGVHISGEWTGFHDSFCHSGSGFSFGLRALEFRCCQETQHPLKETLRSSLFFMSSVANIKRSLPASFVFSASIGSSSELVEDCGLPCYLICNWVLNVGCFTFPAPRQPGRTLNPKPCKAPSTLARQGLALQVENWVHKLQLPSLASLG